MDTSANVRSFMAGTAPAPHPNGVADPPPPAAPGAPENAIDIMVRINDETILAEVAISEMFTAPYARPISPAQIGRMVRSGFDPRALGEVVLSMRPDGRFAILDGAHRRHFAQHFGIKTLLARVFIDLTYEEEARLFVKLNTVKPPTALDKFRSRLESGEHNAVAITHLLARYDLKISNHQGRNSSGKNLTCVSVLDSVYSERGPVEFDEIIGNLHAAWEYDLQAYIGRMVDGMRLFWARYRTIADRRRLTEQLQLTTASRILGLAANKALDSGESANVLVGKEIRNLYNGRIRTNKLPEWQLRVRNPGEDESQVDVTRGRGILGVNAQTPGD